MLVANRPDGYQDPALGARPRGAPAAGAAPRVLPLDLAIVAVAQALIDVQAVRPHGAARFNGGGDERAPAGSRPEAAHRDPAMPAPSASAATIRMALASVSGQSPRPPRPPVGLIGLDGAPEAVAPRRTMARRSL
jgi:hypothetical protein